MVKIDKEKATPAQAKPETKATRKMPTASERVAKLEAQLAEARERANAKVNKETAVKHTRLGELKARVSKLQAEIDLIVAEVGDPSVTVEETETTDDTPQGE